jgi:hypothetical protein
MQNPNLSSTHLTTLRTILGRVNPYVNVVIRATNGLVANLVEEVHICITARNASENGNVLCYNVLMSNNVAMIIPGELGEVGNRDVTVQRQYGGGL